MDDAKEYIYACMCEDESLSIIIPNPNSVLSDEEWKKIHHFDEIDDMHKFHALQLPSERKNRNSWKVEDNAVIV